MNYGAINQLKTEPLKLKTDRTFVPIQHHQIHSELHARGRLMKTIHAWSLDLPKSPTGTVWLLNDLAEFKGKQERETGAMASH
jgi:hypothetical protein